MHSKLWICLLVAGLTWFSALLPGSSAWAQGEVFSVSGVKVDRTASSAAEARERAIAQGHRVALRRLIEKLVPTSDWGQVQTFSLPTERLLAMVSDFAVADERTSDVRYLATLSFRFYPDAVRELLKESEVPFAVTRSKPVLIVPVFGAAAKAVIWEDNPWYALWAAHPRDRGLVPLQVPLGDLGDVASLDPSAALARDPLQLRALADRYEVDEALVSHAEIIELAEGGGGKLQVTTFQVSTLADSPLVSVYSWGPEEAPEAAMARAVEGLDQTVQEQWKVGNLLQTGEERTILVRVDTQNLNDWLELQRRLDKVATVEGVRLRRLTTSQSDIDLDFVGTEYQLTIALAQQDLHLSLAEDTAWEMRLAENVAQPDESEGLEIETQSIEVEDTTLSQ